MKDFKFLKKYGQNFLSDKNLLRAIVADSGTTDTDTVLEVGPGAGALTEAILERAQKLVSVEIDERLIPCLEERFEGVDNFHLINADVMRLTAQDIRDLVGEDFRVVANIPYYITTQLIMRFLEDTPRAKSITVMVQKEVAERLTAKAGDGDYGVISVAVALYGKARITCYVDRRMFYPVPEVDSAVVTIDVKDETGIDIKGVMRLVKASFAMRRKTLRNNLTSGYGITGAQFDEAIEKLGKEATIRGERLTPEEFVALYNLLKK